MKDDAIIEEVRRARQEFAARFQYDVRAMGNYLKSQQRKQKRRVATAHRKKTMRLRSPRKLVRKAA